MIGQKEQALANASARVIGLFNWITLSIAQVEVLRNV